MLQQVRKENYIRSTLTLLCLDSVKNVDKINQETAQPLQEAESLKARADQSREMAAAQLAKAEKVATSIKQQIYFYIFR